MAVMEIREESDFYEPLNPYGRWIAGGRVWFAAGRQAGVDLAAATLKHQQPVGAGERMPAGIGQRRTLGAGDVTTTDDGIWTRAMDGFGFPNPDAMGASVGCPAGLAEAWISAGFPAAGSENSGEAALLSIASESIDPRSFVFVEQRRMLEAQRPQTVIVNNTTGIINNTINTLPEDQVVNKTVINEGPRPEVIAQASGRKVVVTPIQALRIRQERPAIVAQRANPPGTRRKVPATVERHSAIDPEEGLHLPGRSYRCRRSFSLGSQIWSSQTKNPFPLKRKSPCQMSCPSRRTQTSRGGQAGSSTHQARSIRRPGASRAPVETEDRTRPRDQEAGATPDTTAKAGGGAKAESGRGTKAERREGRVMTTGCAV